jgi:signal transduction histidine kinase
MGIAGTVPMPIIDEMKQFVEFGPADERRLRQLWPVVEPHVVRVIDRFYERIQQSPGASSVLSGPDQVERLKLTLHVWLRELLQGPWEEPYADRRRRIGYRHVEVGLGSQYMYTAMAVIQNELTALAVAEVAPALVGPTLRSLQRIGTIDLALMTGTYIEAHERAKLESLQQLIVSNLPVSVYLLDHDGVVISATPSGSRLFGGHAVLGRPLSDVLPATLRTAADFSALLERAHRMGREITMLRLDVTIDAESRSFRLSVIPLDHDLAATLVHLEELTQAVETESRLRRAEGLAQLGALSAAVAHELRNPLAGISGAVQVIARSMDETDVRKHVMEQMQDQIRRLDRMVSDLLSFARPLTPNLTEVDLRAAVTQAEGLMGLEYPDVHLDVSGEGAAMADPDLLLQVLLNVLQNAGQAMDGTGRIEVVVKPQSLRISDGGPGLTPDIGDVFEPFFTTKTRGTGLGLAICRKLCTSMQGGIVSIEDGTPGATFLISLAPA